MTQTPVKDYQVTLMWKAPNNNNNNNNKKKKKKKKKKKENKNKKTLQPCIDQLEEEPKMK